MAETAQVVAEADSAAAQARASAEEAIARSHEAFCRERAETIRWVVEARRVLGGGLCPRTRHYILEQLRTALRGKEQSNLKE